MTLPQVLRTQIENYPTGHRSQANLLLHIVLVPLFVAANVSLIAALVTGEWLIAGASLAVMLLSMALQGRGHRYEQTPPAPFTSPANAVSRIFLEQWVTFPRFVVSGGWWRAYRQRTAL